MEESTTTQNGGGWEFYALKPLLEHTLSKGSNVRNCCVLLVYCPQHGRFALCNSVYAGKHYRWFPWAYMKELSTWDVTCKETLAAVLGVQELPNKAVAKMRCLDVTRLQQPRNLRFVTRVMYYVQLSTSIADICLAAPTVTHPVYVEWFPMDAALRNAIDHLWGPEVFNFVHTVNSKVRIPNIVKELHAADLVNYDQYNKNERQVIDLAQITAYNFEHVYFDFVEHCFPSTRMNFDSFKCYLIKHAIESDDERLASYWNAFRAKDKPSLAFHSLFIGLLAISRDTPHCSHRVTMVFRFYDIDRDSKLNMQEMRRLVRDTCPPGSSPEVIDKALNDRLYVIKYEVMQSKKRKAKKSRRVLNAEVGFRTFIAAVRQSKFSGTSSLCRTTQPICSVIRTALSIRHIPLPPSTVDHYFRQVVHSQTTGQERCEFCLERTSHTPYHLARNTVYLGDKRQIMQVSRQHIKTLVEPPFDDNQAKWVRHSLEVQFNNKLPANKYLKMIRNFSKSGAKGSVRRYFGLFEVIKGETAQKQFVSDFEQIIAQVKDQVRSEPHIIDIASPIYVIGDIHGNIEDLLTLEQHLWPGVPFFGGVNYLFLGDYVDRGRWSFECAFYLFCLKYLAPTRVTLLRGNHEHRQLQITYNYQKEVATKFGPELGAHLWELTNEVFDLLPFGAIIDNVIFGAHGGIPYKDFDVPIRESTKNIPKGIPEPSATNLEHFWQILWSDPIENSQFVDHFNFLTDNGRSIRDQDYGDPDTTKELARELDQQTILTRYEHGYLFNIRRYTALLFNEDAFARFCQVNGFTHMVRAHEVPPEGFRFNFDQKCITVFSCSHYCGQTNQCSVLLIADSQVRAIRLNTTHNAPATPTY